MTKIYRAEAVIPAFSVSVSGHRYLAENDNQNLTKLIKISLQNISNACLNSNANTQLRFNSALAAGADQLAAQAVKEANETQDVKAQWSLQVILPFERHSYEAGLYNNLEVPDGADKFQELLSYADRVFEIADLKYEDYWDEKNTSLAKFWEKNRFHTLGELLVRQSDLLLALWDGKFDGGKGGTSDVITIALRNGKPVLHINPETLKIAVLTPERGITVPLCPDDRIGALSNEDTLELLFKAVIPKNGVADNTVTKKKKSHLEPPEFKGYLSNLVKRLIERPQPLKDTNRFSTIEAFFDDPSPPKTPTDKWKLLFERLIQKVPLARELLPARVFPERTEAYTQWIMYQWVVKLVVWLFPHNEHPIYSPKRLLSFIAKLLSKSVSSETAQQHSKENEQQISEPSKNPPRFQTQVNYAQFDWKQDPILSDSYKPLHKQIKKSDYHLQIAEAEELLHLSMITTDAIATARGHAYRSSYVLIFLGGAMAVLIGLTGLFQPDIKYIFVLIEMLLVSILTGIFLIANQRAWHTRWLNARHISENLRAKRFVTWLGFGGRQSINEDAPWTAWYINSVLASTRLPHTVVTSPDVDYMSAELRGHVKYQQRYHSKNFSKLMSMHHGLEKIGTLCLIVTLAVGFWYVIESFKCLGISPCIAKNTKILVTVLCAGLPVFAGSLLAIRFQGDFERFAERSEQTEAQLLKIDNRLEQLLARKPDSKTQPGYEELVRIVSELTEIYEEDVEDWHYVYSAKHTPEVG